MGPSAWGEDELRLAARVFVTRRRVESWRAQEAARGGRGSEPASEPAGKLVDAATGGQLAAAEEALALLCRRMDEAGSEAA